MAEAFGLAAGVLQVAGFGAEVGGALFKCAKKLHNASKELEAIAGQVEITSLSLRRVDELLRDPATEALHTPKLYEDTNTVSDGCHEVFRELDKSVKAYEAKSNGGKMKILTRTRWLFDCGRLLELGKVLRHYNDVLHLMVSVMTIVEGRRAATKDELQALEADLQLLAISNRDLSHSNKTLTETIAAISRAPKGPTPVKARELTPPPPPGAISVNAITPNDAQKGSPFIAFTTLPPANTFQPTQHVPVASDPMTDHLKRCMDSVQELAKTIAGAMDAWHGKTGENLDVHGSFSKLATQVSTLPKDLQCVHCSRTVSWDGFKLPKLEPGAAGTCICTRESSNKHWGPLDDVLQAPDDHALDMGFDIGISPPAAGGAVDSSLFKPFKPTSSFAAHPQKAPRMASQQGNALVKSPSAWEAFLRNSRSLNANRTRTQHQYTTLEERSTPDTKRRSNSTRLKPLAADSLPSQPVLPLRDSDKQMPVYCTEDSPISPETAFCMEPPFPSSRDALRSPFASSEKTYYSPHLRSGSLSPYRHYLEPKRPPSQNGQELNNDEKEKSLCPFPACGKHFKDLKQHMLTHQNERPEKCHIPTCEYFTRGFFRKYDKNRHVLTHYKGLLLCGFCVGATKEFTRADVFKRHLTSVHGVEQTPPNARRKTTHATQPSSSSARGASGTCNICELVFADAQEFYEHLDDCVLLELKSAVQTPGGVNDDDDEDDVGSPPSTSASGDFGGESDPYDNYLEGTMAQYEKRQQAGSTPIKTEETAEMEADEFISSLSHDHDTAPSGIPDGVTVTTRHKFELSDSSSHESDEAPKVAASQMPNLEIQRPVPNAVDSIGFGTNGTMSMDFAIGSGDALKKFVFDKFLEEDDEVSNMKLDGGTVALDYGDMWSDDNQVPLEEEHPRPSARKRNSRLTSEAQARSSKMRRRKDHDRSPSSGPTRTTFGKASSVHQPLFYSGLTADDDWPQARVQAWLVEHAFFNEWQAAFSHLEIHGMRFLTLGMTGAQHDIALMHREVLPQVSREYDKAGLIPDTAREREGGRKLRRLVKMIVAEALPQSMDDESDSIALKRARNTAATRQSRARQGERRYAEVQSNAPSRSQPAERESSSTTTSESVSESDSDDGLFAIPIESGRTSSYTVSKRPALGQSTSSRLEASETIFKQPLKPTEHKPSQAYVWSPPLPGRKKMPSPAPVLRPPVPGSKREEVGDRLPRLGLSVTPSPNGRPVNHDDPLPKEPNKSGLPPLSIPPRTQRPKLSLATPIGNVRTPQESSSQARRKLTLQMPGTGLSANGEGSRGEDANSRTNSLGQTTIFGVPDPTTSSYSALNFADLLRNPDSPDSPHGTLYCRGGDSSNGPGTSREDGMSGILPDSERFGPIQGRSLDDEDVNEVKHGEQIDERGPKGSKKTTESMPMYVTIPPPPQQPRTYDPSLYAGHKSFAPLPDNQPLTSATYVPGGHSFGPGVGIPPFVPDDQPQDRGRRKTDEARYEKHTPRRPKKKKKMMELGEFLADQSLGSWTDEMRILPLPPGTGNSPSHHGKINETVELPNPDVSTTDSEDVSSVGSKKRKQDTEELGVRKRPHSETPDSLVVVLSLSKRAVRRSETSSGDDEAVDGIEEEMDDAASDAKGNASSRPASHSEKYPRSPSPKEPLEETPSLQALLGRWFNSGATATLLRTEG